MGFGRLKLPTTNHPSRVRPIRELVSEAVLKNYFAVLTKAYISSDDDKSVDNFNELFSKCGLDKTENNLSEIRKKGLIYEGEKVFSPKLSRLLCGESCTSNHVHIRSRETGKIWRYTADKFFNAEEFFVLIDEVCGEFYITDDNNNWYGVLRDDDPIVFFCGQ